MIELEDEKATAVADVTAPVDVFCACTKGTLAKLAPAIVRVVELLGDIVDGVIPLTVGLVSPTVTDPPRETAEPLIVIDEFASFAFAIDPTN